jgi:hypothetical protein
MAMVPLDPAAAWHVRSWLGPPEGPGLLALYHALVYRLPGLWGAPSGSPRSVMLVREGTGQIEAFGAGEPEPAVGWLLRSRRAFVLHAPEPWLEAVRGRLGELDVERVETWAGPGVSVPMPPPVRRPRAKADAGTGAGPGAGARAGTSPGTATGTGAGAATRRLVATDAAAFASVAPPWALRGWRTFPALIEHGAAFGVPHGSGFASLAWVFDRAESFDSIGVTTVSRFRRLGLGRTAASALIDHVVRERGQVPLWSTLPENASSRGLAAALGFSVATVETLLRWPPRAAPDETETE